jgi:hypothetical protein
MYYTDYMNKLITWGSVVLGIGFVIVAIVYFITPAGSLPSYMPGFELDSTHIHIKHAVGSLFLGLALFVYAWFASGPKTLHQ